MTDRNEDGRPRILPMADPEVRQAHDRQAVEPLQTRVGRHWARENGETFCYDHTRGRWMEWTGLRWQADETSLALDRMVTFTTALRLQMPPRQGAPLGSVGFNRGALDVAAASREMARTSADFDNDPYLVGTPTGYIDLRTGEHHRPDQTKMISMSTGVAPADEAKCPKWIDFLTWACAKDAEKVHYLHKFFGYCISGLMREEIMTFVYGPGGNGKGVMLTVLGRVMGEYYLSTPSSTFMDTKKQEHATELARLQHRRLVSASETNEGDKWNIARIKEITGNENPISARFMRQDFFEFWPVCKLLIIGNSKPAFGDVDAAVARRLRLIDFMQTPTHVNKRLKQEFNGEFSSILRWIADGFLLYEKEGLEAPAGILKASGDYLSKEDITSQFLRDVVVRSDGFTTRQDISDLINIWRRDNGVSKKLTNQAIYRRLEEDWGLETAERGRKRGFVGMSIQEQWVAALDLWRQNRSAE